MLAAYYFFGKWNYGVFESLNWTGRVAFMGFVYCLGLVLLNTGVAFHHFIRNTLKNEIYKK